MKAVPPFFRALTATLCAASLPAQEPVLTTPGTATWETVDLGSGTRTTFTILDDTVFDWGQLDLSSGSEMVFDFVGGNSVVNQLGGSGTHVIAGDISANGILGFFAPNSNLVVTGSIVAEGVTLATLGVNPGDFADGGGYHLSGASGFNALHVTGEVHATQGDVVLAGRTVNVHSSARISASGSVLMGGGNEISIASSGARRLIEHSGEGFVLHLGETRASRIEVSAGSEILNRGVLGEGQARVFLEVGDNGLITNEGSGMIVSDAVFEGAFDPDGVAIRPHEGDAATVVSDASLKLPMLKRPNGASVSKSRTISYSAPMSASGDGSRDQVKKREDVAANDRKPLMRKASFFGMRGGERKR